MFQLIGKLLALDIESEILTDKGRIDLVAKTARHIYVIELKYNKSAAQALDQITDKKYFEKYHLDGRTITLVGLAIKQGHEQIEFDCSVQELNGA